MKDNDSPMYKPMEIILQQRSEEWFDYRIGRIGASQIGAIMGLNPWKNKSSVWDEIFLGKRVDLRFNKHVRRGVEYEEEAVAYFSKVLERDFRPAVFQHGDKPKYFASLDGWDGEVTLEVKIPEIYDPTKKEVPSIYYPQVQQQIEVMNSKRRDVVGAFGVPGGWYGEYSPGLKEGNLIWVRQDPDFIKEMFVEGDKFLLSGLQCKPPKSHDLKIVNDPEAIRIVEQYREILNTIEQLKEDAEAMREKLLTTVDHQDCIVGDTKIMRRVRKGSVDYSRIEALKGVNLEEYRKGHSEYWEVRI